MVYRIPDSWGLFQPTVILNKRYFDLDSGLHKFKRFCYSILRGRHEAGGQSSLHFSLKCLHTGQAMVVILGFFEDKSCFLKHKVKEDDGREGNKTQKHEFQRDGPGRWLWKYKYIGKLWWVFWNLIFGVVYKFNLLTRDLKFFYYSSYILKRKKKILMNKKNIPVISFWKLLF